MSYKQMPEVMEYMQGYRNEQVMLSIKRDGSIVPYGASEYLEEYGYLKIKNLVEQLDTSTEPLTNWIQRFLKTFFDLDLIHKDHISMLYCNDNLNVKIPCKDIDVIHQCIGKAKLWIKTLNKEMHEVELEDGDLLVTTSKVKVFRRRPNFISRWIDKFSTFENTYIQNIFQYGTNLSEQVVI